MMDDTEQRTTPPEAAEPTTTEPVQTPQPGIAQAETAQPEPPQADVPQTDADVSALPRRQDRHKKKKSALREMIEVIVAALVLAILIKTFIAGNFWIPSESMEPTIMVNDKVIVTNFSYWFNGPERGDVVVFHYPLDTKRDYIKRCVGLPGETIEFRDSRLYINGEPVDEPYLPDGLIFEDYGPVEIPDGQYFMCGDNRNYSSDSRVWGFVEKRLIIGKAQVIYWPFDRWSRL